MQRKSGFLTFCFACLPGAGEMYLGYMKRGLSVMIAFWGLIFVASLLNMGILGILAPIIWAYSGLPRANGSWRCSSRTGMHP